MGLGYFGDSLRGVALAAWYLFKHEARNFFRRPLDRVS
jgi:hypothetical protein